MSHGQFMVFIEEDIFVSRKITKRGEVSLSKRKNVLNKSNVLLIRYFSRVYFNGKFFFSQTIITSNIYI